MKNIFFNLFKPGYLNIIFKKIFKRFEKDTSIEALNWAKEKCKCTTDELCISIDKYLFEEVKSDIKVIENEAKNRLLHLDFSLGGGGNYLLLNFLVRKFKPDNVVETGVAAVKRLQSFKRLKKTIKVFFTQAISHILG